MVGKNLNNNKEDKILRSKYDKKCTKTIWGKHSKTSERQN